MSAMSGILDNAREYFDNGRRNTVASAVSGGMFFTAWWLIFDLAARASLYGEKDFENSYYTCGVLQTLALFMINSVSNQALRGDGYTEGCVGPRGARTWLFIGFVLGFASLIASGWILFLGGRDNSWPVAAIFLQNLLIFISALVYKFGRSEDLWA